MRMRKLSMILCLRGFWRRGRPSSHPTCWQRDKVSFNATELVTTFAVGLCAGKTAAPAALRNRQGSRAAKGLSAAYFFISSLAMPSLAMASFFISSFFM
jgi:hypothetical protein